MTKKFSWKEVINPRTMKKFKAMKATYDFWDKENKDISRGLETGFCIDGKGNILPNEFAKDLVIGTDKSIKLSSACKFGKTHDPLFGEKHFTGDKNYDYEPKYAIHSHPGFPGAENSTFSKRFSPDDLLMAQSYDDIPCIVWREETYEVTESSKKKGFGYYKRKPYDNWYIKCHPNVPKERMKVITEYGKQFDLFKKREKRLLKKYKNGDILKLNDIEYREYQDKVNDLHGFMKKTLDRHEKKAGIETKKLFKYWYRGY